MPASEARIAAARANGLKSRGPVTAEGKAISRRNAYKHGMAGDGVVLPTGDSAEVERRGRAMMVEMRPGTEMGRYLVGRLAELTVRVERCSRHERAATDRRVLHAGAAFDEARIAEVDHAIDYIRADPTVHARKLRSMPEGVDRLIACLLDLREELNTGRWDWSCGEKVANLQGTRWMEVPVTRPRALSEAINGKFEYLLAGDGEGLSTSERVDWARNAMADLIDDELVSLLAIRETLDEEAIEQDRAGAAARALFDPSKEATLARRYEAAAERGVYRALRELPRVEAESAPIEPGPEPAEAPEPEEPLGSFRAEGPEADGPAASTGRRSTSTRAGESSSPLSPGEGPGVRVPTLPVARPSGTPGGRGK